jgi:AraC-like DNA-binding protein
MMGRHAKPVTYNGITYESVYDCAAAFDLSANAVRWRLKHSLPLEPALGFRRMVTYDGRAWTLRELAEHCGVSPYTIARRLRRGGDPAFSGHCGRACEYNGRRYASISAFAREAGIPYASARELVSQSGRWL